MSRSVRSTLQPAVIKYYAVTVPSNRLKWIRTSKICWRNHRHNFGIWRNALGTSHYSPVIHFPPDAESLSHIGTVCCNSLQCTNTKFNVNNSHTTNIVSRRNNNNDYHCLTMSCLGLHTQPTAGVSLFAAYLPPGGNLLMQQRYFTKAPCKQYALQDHVTSNDACIQAKVRTTWRHFISGKIVLQNWDYLTYFFLRLSGQNSML